MPGNDTHDAHDYAERIRARLPRLLQVLRERCGLSKFALARESGVSREYIGNFERGKASHHAGCAQQARRTDQCAAEGRTRGLRSRVCSGSGSRQRR
ncbi:MAG TPA: hypothetical protein DIT64_15075 [Verrucomicrobiales bacterium]|nr:hypothetical protein [Verrucomicrobiales bacterium]HCN77245.1 hypothetical protein [Verrucomicrobiales bacterium]